jgi:hypothetical protein
MEEQYVYLEDTFGLKTLNERGGVIIEQEPNVSHSEWLFNTQLFLNDILPWLT